MRFLVIEMEDPKMERAVADRWESRIVPRGWDRMGADGALAYLEKYGKTMGEKKMQAFAQYARFQGAYEFAAEMMRQLRDRFGHEYKEEEPKKRTVWECPRCGRLYGTKQEASDCRR
jgi:rubrerythrin